MISTSDFKRGTKIEFRGEPYEILDFQHVKMGRGSAFVRTKMKGLRTGKIIEETFSSGDKVPKPELEEKEMQYLYKQDNLCYFMDTGTYEQVPVTEEQLGDSRKYLKESMNVYILYYKDEAIAVELPNFVELKVAQTEPGFKGDTASGGSKPAILETGASVKVPFHINEGDIIKVDTRTGEYIERVKG
ncbi:Translation elongation factor P [hydrothermal vent metagenome]|uniref:Translation elongation factor P n=1 Tax=hydrothermal vent metagenome TaxID=652676 RepID=A0A3B1DID6_9ZZZZ